MNIICNIEVNNISINSIPNIYKNKYYKCIEFFNIYEKIRIGIKVCFQMRTIQYNMIYSSKNEIFNYNKLVLQKENIFDPLFLNNKYKFFIEKINDLKLNIAYKLKKSYFQYPIYNLKRESYIFENVWAFKNIYNYYFCFCKGKYCLTKNIDETCKYNYYLYIIDNNKDIYKKTDYLFFDFIFSDLSSDDVYPIFQEMEKENIPVHYITEKVELYNEYCTNISKCLIILQIQNRKKPIDSNFLEKYLEIFLKLKIVVSGRGTTFNTDLFFNIHYINYIGVVHGVCYFKYYLYDYNRIYGIAKNNKLLLPPSEKIISIAKSYGWKDENIIKINLPRWDKYDNNSTKISFIFNNSIFIMFTWRKIIKRKSISKFYLENIIKLIMDNTLNKALKLNNIILYLSFHRLVDEKYINSIRIKTKKENYIKYINQNLIAECLSKTNLVVTDFSSIIFDLMYRRKPFVIYIPDVYESKLKYIYENDYYQLIQYMKNGDIYFENKFFSINQTVNKIIFYINNNFALDKKLEKFYDNFRFKKENGIKKFIDYLKELK